MLNHIVTGKDQTALAGTSYSNTRSGASSGARELTIHTTSVLGAVASAAAGVVKSHLLPSAITTVAKLNGGPLGGARPAIMIATATETLAAPVAVAMVSLTSLTPTKPIAAVCKTTDITTTDVTPPLLLLPSPETKSTAVPSRGRSTSPRARGGRPPSPRRSPRALSRSPSPQRLGTAVRAAAMDASSWSAAGRPAVSRVGGDFSFASAAKGVKAPEQGSGHADTLDVSDTPPLTPASPVPSPAAAISEVWSSNTVSFFGTSYSRDDDGVDLSQGGYENRASPIKQRNIQPVRGSRVATSPNQTKLVVPVDAGQRTEKATAAAPVGEGSDDCDKTKRTSIDVLSGDIRSIVKGSERGVIRAAFIGNVRQRQAATVGEGCALVQAARVALGGSGGGIGASSSLHESGVIGEGSFGIVEGATHSFLPGEFAVKKLKEGADNNARYCARVEMIVMARLAKSPHPNVIGAIAIDDREAAVGMPILLPRAHGDFGQVLNDGDWSMAQKLSCLQQVASGVRHMHEAGIGHGDLTPPNILLVDDGDGECVPKISDFGLARALGEMRPKMMGTLGSMPLEVMQASVRTSESQDTFAMGAMAFTVCVTPDKVQANMSISPDLFTAAEAKAKKALEAKGTGPFAMAERNLFERNMMERTMSTRAFESLLTVDNLHPDLGSARVRGMVSCYLSAFLATDLDDRGDMASFEKVMGDMIEMVEDQEETDHDDEKEGDGSESEAHKA
ncbi:unnamed protein product [Ectocarpus sp. 6 AP-2014]